MVKNQTLLTLMGGLARSQGLKYLYKAQTLWGTPLSGMWSGKMHSKKRDVSALLHKRVRFEATASTYDTMVLVEAVPLEGQIKYEYSSYYLQQFYCTLTKANPVARVYLFEGWISYHAGKNVSVYGPKAQYNWKERMHTERLLWEKIADEASGRQVRSPGYMSWLKSTLKSTAPVCDQASPIFIVPVGRAMVELLDRTKSPKQDDYFKYADGQPFQFDHFFDNTYTSWPKNWPLSPEEAQKIDENQILSELSLRKPGENKDDIHPSELGVYFNALVHYATLYRRSPVGLPIPRFIGQKLGQTLQCIVWETVLNDPRAGVLGKFEGCPGN